MIRGLYTAAQAMVVNQKRHDIANNNLANVETPGYRAEDAIVRSFPEHLLYNMGKNTHPHWHAPADSHAANARIVGRPPAIGYLAQGITVEEVATRFDQGLLRETGNQFDIAIIDRQSLVAGAPDTKGFYAVKQDLDSDEIFYTRAGNLRLRQELVGAGETERHVQYLTTQDGEYIMQRQILGGVFTGELEPVEIIEEEFTVYANGEIDIHETGFPSIRGQLHIVEFTEAQLPGLHKLGHGLWQVDEQLLGADFAPQIAVNTETRQKIIEMSNVDPTQAMLNIMIAQRSYEANQRVIQTMDRNLDKAVNEIGRL